MRYFQCKYRGQEPFRDQYDGVPFEIKTGETKVIDEAAARHIFGLGEQDKTRALSRLGWLRVSEAENPGGMKEALARLGQFVFTELTLTAKDDSDNGTSNARHVSSASQKAAA